MCLLAHAIRAAPGLEAARRDLDRRIKTETKLAKEYQHKHGCSWAEAVRAVTKGEVR